MLLAATDEDCLEGSGGAPLNAISEASMAVTQPPAGDLPHTSSQDEFTSFSESPLWSGGPTITAIGAKSAEGEILDFNREVGLSYKFQILRTSELINILIIIHHS